MEFILQLRNKGICHCCIGISDESQCLIGRRQDRITVKGGRDLIE